MKLICPGRQFRWKNPVHIVEAVGSLPEVFLLLVGDGPLHKKLVDAAQRLCPGRCRLVRAMENRALVKEIVKADAVVLNTYYHEWSKVMIEAMLLGTPVIVNQETAGNLDELSRNSSVCEFCADSESGYAAAIKKTKNKTYRESLARRAKKLAWRLAAPKIVEAEHASMVLGVVKKLSGHAVD